MSSNIEISNVVLNKYLIENRTYYDKRECTFVICEYCFWFATLLKNISYTNICPICRKSKILKNFIF